MSFYLIMFNLFYQSISLIDILYFFQAWVVAFTVFLIADYFLSYLLYMKIDNKAIYQTS